MKIQKSLRPVILIELLFPLMLLVFGIYQGVLQTLYRAGIIRATSFGGIEYYQGLTAHGVINAVVLTTFFAVAFGNAVVSQFLGVSISTSAALGSLGLMILGVAMTAVMIFSGKASVLYTFYPPLKAHPLFYIGLALFIIGSWIAFYSWIPAYLRWRKENPDKKTPLAVVGILSTFVVWQIATVPVAYEVLVLLLPWSMGFVPGVNVVLARTLFWFFGHPLVYFWLLPTYVMYYTMLPKLSGGKLFSDFAGRLAFLMFCVLSSPLGLHHQFADAGIASNWKALHAVLTSLVAVPSMITAFTMAASLEFAARSRGGKGLFAWWGKLPYFDPENWLFPFLFCGLVIFIFGGLTGVVNASYGMNAVVHNTAWMPAHFHMTVAGPVFLGILGMSLYLIVGLLGKPLVMPRAAMMVPYLWTTGILFFSGGLFYGGLHGEPRRTNMGLTYLNAESPAYRRDWYASTHIAAVGGSIMAFAVLIYFVVLIRSLLAPATEKAKEDFALPASEAYHDEDIAAVRNFRPWVVAAVAAVVVTYTPPILQIMQGNYRGAPGYEPDNPIAVSSRK
jgi:cytochrome c oxidase subunit 1